MITGFDKRNYQLFSSQNRAIPKLPRTQNKLLKNMSVIQNPEGSVNKQKSIAEGSEYEGKNQPKKERKKQINPFSRSWRFGTKRRKWKYI